MHKIAYRALNLIIWRHTLRFRETRDAIIYYNRGARCAPVHQTDVLRLPRCADCVCVFNSISLCIYTYIYTRIDNKRCV